MIYVRNAVSFVENFSVWLKDAFFLTRRDEIDNYFKVIILED